MALSGHRTARATLQWATCISRTAPPTAALLQLLAADRQWPNLYEPRLVTLGGKRFSFIGFERNGQAWVLQNWDCELL